MGINYDWLHRTARKSHEKGFQYIWELDVVDERWAAIVEIDDKRPKKWDKSEQHSSWIDDCWCN